jgi:hypothetical protein
MREDYRLFACGGCQQLVAVCSHCDRGQVYCGSRCSAQARCRSLRGAGRRYQATDRGRRRHAARQARYLARRDAKMTHQATPAVVALRTLAPAAGELARELRGWVVGLDEVLCGFCGVPCRPYGRWSFLRRRRR